MIVKSEVIYLENHLCNYTDSVASHDPEGLVCAKYHLIDFI